MTERKDMPIRTQVYWGIICGLIAGAIVAIGALASCTADENTKTADAIYAASRAAIQQQGTLGQLKGTVDGMTPANLATEKPKAQADVAYATDQNHTISTSLGVAAAGAKQDAKKISGQQKTITKLNNTVRVRLNWIGITLLVAGLAGVVCGLFFKTFLGGLTTIACSAGGASIVTGIGVLAVAEWLPALLSLMHWMLVVGLAGLAVWVFFHYHTNVDQIWSMVVGMMKTAKAKITGLFKSPTAG